MGIVLDAYALVAFLGRERAAPEVRDLLRSGDAAIPSVNLAEAGQRVLRASDISSAELRELVGSIPLAVIPLTEAHAWRAVDLRARHYRRETSAVSLADCCLVAVATPLDRVATADRAVLEMAAAEGIGTAELPRP